MNNQNPNPSRNTLRNRMNKSVNNVLPVNVTFVSIPIDEICQAVRDNGAMVMQEDGEEFGGFLIGRDSGATFEVKHSAFEKPFYMRLTWYKREGSGRYEVVCYIS